MTFLKRARQPSKMEVEEKKRKEDEEKAEKKKKYKEIQEQKETNDKNLLAANARDYRGKLTILDS